MFYVRLILISVLVIHIGSNHALSQCTDDQYTIATVNDHFKAQAINGIPFSYPLLVLSSETRDGHFGTLRTDKDNNTECRTVNVTYRVNKKTTEGVVVFIDYDMPAFWQKFAVPSNGSARTTAPPPSQRIPAEKKTEGPFLMVAPELGKLPEGATFEPKGLWLVHASVSHDVELDGKIVRREMWQIEKIKPDVVSLPAHPAVFTGVPRKWKDTKGKPLLDGIFLDWDEQKKSVRISSTDREVSEIPFFDLSLSDRKWIKEQISARESRDHNANMGYGGEGGSPPSQNPRKGKRK
jgi:hypothetical protein